MANTPPSAEAVDTSATAALIPMSPAILEAQETFSRELPQLLKEIPGQWVAYLGKQRIAQTTSKVRLCQQCFDRGYEEFFVRCIEPEVEIDFISAV